MTVEFAAWLFLFATSAVAPLGVINKIGERRPAITNADAIIYLISTVIALALLWVLKP